MINKDRLKDTFAALVSIDSESKQEQAFAQALRERLNALGAETFVDDAGQKTGSNTGNLIAKFRGLRNVSPLLLSAHMDTVAPGKNIQPIFKNGIFSSAGATVLGADDKSAIAIILETLQLLNEKNIPHSPLELILTVCEENALDGVKHLDFGLITATQGYALDATDTEGIITRAPAANRFTFQVNGKEAHAGAAPEKGINANIFFEKGIMVGVLGTGMHDVHTRDEWVPIDDMVRMVELLLEIIKVHAKQTPSPSLGGQFGGKNE